MSEIPNVPQFYSDVHYARMFLNAASREDDPERQRSLAAIGQGFAQLAQVEASWLGSAGAQESQQPPAPPTPPDLTDSPEPQASRRLDLRTAARTLEDADDVSGTYRPI
jgi:hypothetical protein